MGPVKLNSAPTLWVGGTKGPIKEEVSKRKGRLFTHQTEGKRERVLRRMPKKRVQVERTKGRSRSGTAGG